MAQHLSIRVPWHDNGWTGCVCNNPDCNQACRVLKNIALARSDLKREQCQPYASNEVSTNAAFVPPCLTESGMFMSEHRTADTRNHPYVYDGHYKHIVPTQVFADAHTFLATPYKWTLRDGSSESPNVWFYTQFDESIEINVGSNNWVSNGINQKRIFEYFYENVVPSESVIVVYAKAVPFIESSGRILIGLGCVESVGALKEYDYSKTPTGDMMTSFLWERSISHSIRTNRKNGFLFPFDEMKKYINNNPLQNPDELVVIAPDDYRNEFSYATEHLSHDALILTLNKTISVLKKYNEIGLSYGKGSSWDDCIKWCHIQLEKAWKDRGAYPGLGAVLSALGVPYGFDVAKAIKAKYNDNELWENIANSIENLSAILPNHQKGILKGFTTTKRENVAELLDEKQSYLRLLSRITLTLPQAKLLVDDATRSDRWLCNYADQLTNIHNNDLSAAVIENPYTLFEKTYRLEEKYRIGIGKIDLALFPPEFVAEQFFSGDDSNRITEQDDKRRLRAIIVFILEQEASNGSSLMLACDLIASVGKFRSDVPDIEPEVRLATLQSKRRKDFFEEYFIQFPVELIPESGNKRTETALQLVRLQQIGSKISEFVNNRIDHSLSIHDDWDLLLNSVLKKEQQSEKGREQESRKEKVIAIEKMACSKISVLTGGAGTGKTTTLAALCKSNAIQSEGILVLAPTGKARVVLSSKLRKAGVRSSAKTLFQFLKSSKHCDTNTWSYYLSGKVDDTTPGTVIIDECSMLTEEMFAALIEAVRNAKRVIFVGDPNQLPPIGTGKPFYDLVQKLKDQNGQPHYANLLVSNRQKQGGTTDIRLDVELSKLFSEDLVFQVPEDLFTQISLDNTNIEFIQCEETATLPSAIEQALAKIGITDIPSFDALLGGELESSGKWMNFNSAASVENWQILSPYRNKEVVGTSGINALVQSIYRIPKPINHRSTPAPLGVDGIRFAEKVINVQNQDRSSKNWKGSVWSPTLPMDRCECYTANGEIGLITGLKEKKYHYVQFANQDGYIYNFYSGASEDSPLELAYALTVHKAQGSGFKSTIFVLIEPERGINPMVTREMLYTALTRQSEKVFIIYNKEPSEIRKYSGVELSALAHRKTNLFGNTVFRQVKDGWYDSKHIFITEDGTKVLSKSEVIVYNMLFESGLNPIYERELRLGDVIVHPDFTIETTTGDVFWEHLGMLGDYGYRKDWERKKKLYSEHGISIEHGNLILSQDELNGAIDSAKIKSQIEKITR